jgi:cytoskeleton protein RodZ
LVIISVIIGVKKTIDKYEKEATLPQVIEQPGQTEAAIPTKGATPPEVTPEGANPLVGSASLQQSSDGTNINSNLQNLNISPDALNLTSKPQNIDNQANASPVPTPNVTTQLEFNPQEVIIEALDKVVVEYAIDGGPKNSLALVAEKIHTFKAKKNITLSFSDGGSVNLIHNGKDKGVPGNLGQPVIVSFPK